MGIEVTYKDGLISVHRKDTPEHCIRWTPEMWEQAVWQSIVDGYLPPMARAVEDKQPDSDLPGLSKWTHGPVIWDGAQFGEGGFEADHEEWLEFTDRIRDGTYSVESLIGEDSNGK